jgi:hypothetical protein
MIVPFFYRWGVLVVHLTRKDGKWRGEVRRGLGYSFTTKHFGKIAQAARWARAENEGSDG